MDGVWILYLWEIIKVVTVHPSQGPECSYLHLFFSCDGLKIVELKTQRKHCDQNDLRVRFPNPCS